MDDTGLFAPLPWQGIGLTDTGLVRTSNQDAFVVENQIGLWVVADGMGGHAGGSVASQLAVQSVVEHVRASRELWPNSFEQEKSVFTFLEKAVAEGDEAIRRQATTTPDLTGMGTTLVVALLLHGPPIQIAIAHVGDSRAYQIRNQTIRALTADHSLVQKLLTEGRISQKEAQIHPQQNVLLKALGAEDRAVPDIELRSFKPQDILLLCTDGLTKTVAEQEILSTVLEMKHSPLMACQQLIDRANAAGGKDNTTVVLITPHSFSR